MPGKTDATINPSAPHFGESITYDLTNPPANCIVKAEAYQGGTLVYAEFSIWPKDNTFTLGPTPLWQSGGASGRLLVGTHDNGRIRMPKQPTLEFSILE